MTSQLTLPAVALWLSAISFLLSLLGMSRGRPRHLRIASLLISGGIVTLSTSQYFGLVGRAMSSVALLSAALSVAGAAFLYRANKKPASSGTA